MSRPFDSVSQKRREAPLDVIEALLKTRVEIDCGYEGLEDPREYGRVLGAAAQALSLAEEEVLVERYLLCEARKGEPVDELGPHPGELALVDVRELPEEHVAYYVREYGVAEEFEPLVGLEPGPRPFVQERPVNEYLFHERAVRKFKRQAAHETFKRIRVLQTAPPLLTSPRHQFDGFHLYPPPVTGEGRVGGIFHTPLNPLPSREGGKALIDDRCHSATSAGGQPGLDHFSFQSVLAIEEDLYIVPCPAFQEAGLPVAPYLDKYARLLADETLVEGGSLAFVQRVQPLPACFFLLRG